jgi:hypothetical protein
MTMWLAEVLLDTAERDRGAGGDGPRNQVLDPGGLAARVTRERIRGIGQATREFIRNHRDLGQAGEQAGVSSPGNGTAPKGLPAPARSS